MIRNLDLMLVRAFVVVADVGSVTGAAERLHLTQGAVSQRILRLEDVLGLTLFTRNARGVALTPEGQAFLIRARRLLEVNDEILGEMRARRPVQRVRLGLPPDLVPHVFEALVEGLGAEHPDAEIELACAVSPELERRVGEGMLDLAVIEAPLAGEDMILARRRLLWIGREAAAARRPLPLSFASPVAPSAPSWRRRSAAPAFPPAPSSRAGAWKPRPPPTRSRAMSSGRDSPSRRMFRSWRPGRSRSPPEPPGRPAP